MQGAQKSSDKKMTIVIENRSGILVADSAIWGLCTYATEYLRSSAS